MQQDELMDCNKAYSVSGSVMALQSENEKYLKEQVEFLSKKMEKINIDVDNS